jgi:hypothetical protein
LSKALVVVQAKDKELCTLERDERPSSQAHTPLELGGMLRTHVLKLSLSRAVRRAGHQELVTEGAPRKNSHGNGIPAYFQTIRATPHNPTPALASPFPIMEV